MKPVTHVGTTAMSNDFPDFTPTIDDLVQIARTSGRPGATVSTIRHWRNRGLVSAPFRHEGVWRYPLVAIGEVDFLVRYGRRQLGDDLLDFGRYVETGVGSPAEVREACLRLLGGFREGASEAAALAAEGSEALHAVAVEMAAKRGGNALLPREVRMRAQERIEAHEYMLNKLLQVEMEPELESRGAAQVARGLGLSGGRGGRRQDVLEVLSETEQWHLDLDALLGVVAEAPVELAELARRSVALQHLWMPAMISSLWDGIPARDAALLRVAERIAEHQTPKMYPLAYAAAVVRKRRTLTPAAIHEAFAGPDEATTVAAAVLESPDADESLARVSRLLRPYPRVQLRLAVAKLRVRQSSEGDPTGGSVLPSRPWSRATE